MAFLASNITFLDASFPTKNFRQPKIWTGEHCSVGCSLCPLPFFTTPMANGVRKIKTPAKRISRRITEYIAASFSWIGRRPDRAKMQFRRRAFRPVEKALTWFVQRCGTNEGRRRRLIRLKCFSTRRRVVRRYGSLKNFVIQSCLRLRMLATTKTHLLSLKSSCTYLF